MTILSAQEILDCDDMPTQLLAVPQWGGDVLIKGLSQEQATDIRKQATIKVPGPTGELVDGLDQAKFEGLLFVASCAQPAFTADQAPLLRKKSAAAFGFVVEAISKLNGWTKAEQQAAEKSVSAGSDASV